MIPRHHFTDLNTLRVKVPIGAFTCEVLYWGYYDPKWWRNYLHEHSFFEVCYVYAGAGTFRLKGHVLSVHPGDVFVALPGDPHEIIADETNPMGIYFWAYTLVPKQGQSAPVDPLLQAFTHSQQATRHCPSLERVLELLIDEIYERQMGYTEAIRALTSKLILDTARAVTNLDTAEEPDPINPNLQISQQIVRYLQDNFNRPVRIRDVAAHVHLSERHTNRIFRQIYQLSIKEYLIQYRLQVAKQLLLNAGVSIREVALHTGYQDNRYFATVFRQRTGVSPSEYREGRGTSFLT